jgi:hypothetical protein
MLTFHDLSRPDFAEVQAAVSKIPFLWSEDILQGGTYIALMYVPITDVINVSSYINNSFTNLLSKVDVGFVEPTNANSFTIPYHMYRDNRWRFDPKQLESSLRKESVVPLGKNGRGLPS